MRMRVVGLAILVATLALLPVSWAQNDPPALGGGDRNGQGQKAAPNPAGENQNIHLDGWDKVQVPIESTGKKPGPAPVHDLSGIWEPVPRYRDGVFASGPRDMPSDAKHEAMMPYTQLGKETMAEH